jgi:hypothetical protein
MEDAVDELEKFMVNWGGSKCKREDDCLIYSVAPLWGKRAAESANKLIRTLKLNLIAEDSGLLSSDSFTVKYRTDAAV